MFYGIGCLFGKYDIKVDYGVKLVVVLFRRIFYILKDKVCEEF